MFAALILKLMDTNIIPELTALQEEALCLWYSKRQAEYEAKLDDPHSPESKELEQYAAQYSAWAAELDYYSHVNLGCDRYA